MWKPSAHTPRSLWGHTLLGGVLYFKTSLEACSLSVVEENECIYCTWPEPKISSFKKNSCHFLGFSVFLSFVCFNASGSLSPSSFPCPYFAFLHIIDLFHPSCFLCRFFITLSQPLAFLYSLLLCFSFLLLSQSHSL